MEEREPATISPLALHGQFGFGGAAVGGENMVSGSLSWTLSPVTALSPPPVTQPSGHGPGLPWGTFGQAEQAPAFLVEDPQKHWCCPLGLGWGAWHKKQVSPALPVSFSFSFIINLGHNPGHQRVPNDQLFERPGVSRLGISFQIRSLQERLLTWRQPPSYRTCHSQIPQLEFLNLLYRQTSSL